MDEVNRKLTLLKLVEEMGSITEACQVMGYSRPSYYRFKKLFNEGGMNALTNKKKREGIEKNRVSPSVEESILLLSLKSPAFGPKRISRELEENGIKVSATGVRGVWIRNKMTKAKQRISLSKE